jgi:hypothetical protein
MRADDLLPGRGVAGYAAGDERIGKLLIVQSDLQIGHTSAPLLIRSFEGFRSGECSSQF